MVRRMPLTRVTLDPKNEVWPSSRLASGLAVIVLMANMSCSRAFSITEGSDRSDSSVDRSKSTQDAAVVPNADSGTPECEEDPCPQLCEPGYCNDWVLDPDDFDGDGHVDGADNCPFTANSSQLDTDEDNRGDPCDLCPHQFDTDQVDTDNDGRGDNCDADIDNDAVVNAADNCPLVPNPAQSDVQQTDTDGDGLGDACDIDTDGDGIPNLFDNCPLVHNPFQLVSDPVAFGSACDTDLDMDDIMDSKDNCRMVANNNQTDTDGDLVGDVCDADIDDDGITNTQDNCILAFNPHQEDMDRDGKGDVCDSRFCYYVSGPDGAFDWTTCLDPTDIFKVYSPGLNIPAGEPVILPIYVNRPGENISYTWAVTNHPSGSKVGVIHSSGECSTTQYLACWYEKTAPAGFIGDVPGTYRIKVTALLAGQDPVNPTWPTKAITEMTITVGDPISGTPICIPDKCFD